MNPLETLETYYTDIHLQRGKLLEFETSWLENSNIELVVVDATPLGRAVGQALAGASGAVNSAVPKLT